MANAGGYVWPTRRSGVAPSRWPTSGVPRAERAGLGRLVSTDGGDEAVTGTVDLGVPGMEDAVEIGRGGFAVVYRARQPELNRTVAIKMLSARLDESGREQFAREGW